MPNPVPMIELFRGGLWEATHLGHAVVVDQSGDIRASWGDPDLVVLPRSSVKMVQALPLVESGAADAIGLTDRQLALACASHTGARIHTDAVRAWLTELGFSDDDLVCGPQEPRDLPARDALIRAGDPVCRCHNNCSGKHTGFLTYARHLRTELDYATPDNPVQIAVRTAFEDLTGDPSPGFGIDGCSAPNFACTLTGLARAMAFFANAPEDGSTRERAAFRLHRAMAMHPEMVHGVNRVCTRLMQAMEGRAAVKIGADGVYTGILPDLGLGIALKIADGASRGAEAAMTALLIHLGALDANHPTAKEFGQPDITNFAGLTCGTTRPAPGFPSA